MKIALTPLRIPAARESRRQNIARSRLQLMTQSLEIHFSHIFIGEVLTKLKKYRPCQAANGVFD